MDRRAVITWDTAIILLVLSIFAILFIAAVFGPAGLIQKVKEMSNAVFGMVPNAPDKAAPKGEVPVPPIALQVGFNRLILALEKDVEGPCIIDWKDKDEKDKGKHLPSDFAGFTISFRKAGDKFDASLSKDNIEFKGTTISKQVCVVAGKTDSPRPASFLSDVQKSELAPKPSSIVAENFYNNWIIEGKAHGQFRLPEYNDVYTIEITGDDVMVMYDNEGAHELEKEDDGLLYVPEKGNVCFFGTNYEYDYDEEGIEKSILKDPDESRYILKKLKACS